MTFMGAIRACLPLITFIKCDEYLTLKSTTKIPQIALGYFAVFYLAIKD
ncbi:hypothetical protein [Moraxella lacunata]